MKKTFTRLPQEKQNKILEGFLREFAQHDYGNASISRVVKELGIAKGSVYQYFGGKLDLYQQLLAKCQEVKMAYVFGISRDDYPDFWAFYRDMFLRGIQFDLERPVHSQLLFRASQDRSNPAFKSILTQNFQQGLSVFTKWIEEEQTKGLIQTSFEASFIALTVVKQSQAIQEYLMDVVGYDPFESIERDNQVFAGQKEDILRFVDQSIRLFQKSFSN